MTGPLVFLGGMPWSWPFATALAAHTQVVWIELRAAGSVRRDASTDSSVERLEWTYPPGFNGVFASLFEQRILARVKKLDRELFESTGRRPVFLTSYPKFLPFLHGIEPARLIYYNQDDNARVMSNGVRRSIEAEDRLVESAALVICASRYQTDQLKRRAQGGCRAIHLPHGVAEETINPRPDLPPSRRVFVVGALSYRNDWTLIDEVVRAMPDVHFLFVGDVDTRSKSNGEWRRMREAVLTLPNVEHKRYSTDRENAMHGWNSAVHWLPYDPALPFNVACCPLRLFIALASGRAIVSAPIPECEQYPQWVRTYADAAQAIQTIRRSLDESHSPDAQIAFAKANTWQRRASQVIEMLDELNPVEMYA